LIKAEKICDFKCVGNAGKIVACCDVPQSDIVDAKSAKEVT